jgi:hypothetical protein
MRIATFVGLLWIASFAVAQDAASQKAAIAYLQALRQSDGGYLQAVAPSGTDNPRSSLRATSSALRALKYFGGEVKETAQTAKFVRSCYSPTTGSFGDTPGAKGDVTLTAVGMMAVDELKIPDFDFGPSVKYLVENAEAFEDRRIAVAGMEVTKKFPPEVRAWNAAIDRTRNAQGTFGMGKAVVVQTGSVVAMVLRSGEKLAPERIVAVTPVLVNGQLDDGGYGTENVSDLGSTYRVMRALHLLGEKPKDVAKLQKFIASCQNRDGGFGVQPGKPSTVSGTYYAAILGYWLK